MTTGSQQSVIIDDLNEDFVTFSGQWSRQGSFIEFNGTTTQPITPGGTMTFKFNGTHVAIFGTRGPDGNSTTLMVAVDNGPVQPVDLGVVNNEGAQYHIKFFESDLPDGPHTMVASVPAIGGSAEGSGSNLYIDYLVVTPSAGTSTGQGVMSFYDDTDPAFQYSGSWSTDDGISEDMQGTLHGALALNSSASLQFTGTFVNVYGRIPLNTGADSIAQFVIDGGTPFVAKYPSIQNIVFDQSQTSSNFRLFHNASLSSGPHVMIITPLTDQILWIDYATSGDGVDTANAGQAAANVPSPNTIAPITPSQTPSPSATRLPSSSGHSKVTTDVVAGVVGGLSGLIVLTLIMFCVRWRLKKQKEMEEILPRQLPFPDHLQQAPLSDGFFPVGGNSSVRTSSDNQRGMPYSHKHGHRPPPSSASGPESSGDGQSVYELARMMKAAAASSIRPQTTLGSASTISAYSSPTVATPGNSTSVLIPLSAVQHHDSGMRGLAVPETVVEVPPMYSED